MLEGALETFCFAYDEKFVVWSLVIRKGTWHTLSNRSGVHHTVLTPWLFIVLLWVASAPYNLFGRRVSCLCLVFFSNLFYEIMVIFLFQGAQTYTLCIPLALAAKSVVQIQSPFQQEPNSVWHINHSFSNYTILLTHEYHLFLLLFISFDLPAPRINLNREKGLAVRCSLRYSGSIEDTS